MSKKQKQCFLQMNADILSEHIYSFEKSCEANKWDITQAEFIVDDTGAYFEINKTKVYIYGE